MADPLIRSTRTAIADDVSFGPGVVIETDDLEIDAGARIGVPDDDAFRTPHGVLIRAEKVRIGARASIAPAVRIEGGAITLGDDVRILRHSTIRVLDELDIGQGGTVNEGCEISGRVVRIGQELWMLSGAKIGGGSAFEAPSRLEAGHYLHLGVDTLINTARPVTLGHEVGLGTRTSIYTHGAYPSVLQGFPVAFEGVEIGDFTWIPGAIINPGVRIGRNCIVGVNSLVNASIPDGSLAAGSPAKVIREGAYPMPMDHEAQLDFYELFLTRFAIVLGVEARVERDESRVKLTTTGTTYVAGTPVETSGRTLTVGSALPAPVDGNHTAFDTQSRRISGTADTASGRLANELRRYGIRFYSRPRGDRYEDWAIDPPRYDSTSEDQSPEGRG